MAKIHEPQIQRRHCTKRRILETPGLLALAGGTMVFEHIHKFLAWPVKRTFAKRIGNK